MPSATVIAADGWSALYTDYGYYFDKFTCSIAICCTQPDLTYELATTNTDPPALVDASLYTMTWESTHNQMELIIEDRATLDTVGEYYIYVTNPGSNTATAKSPYQYAFSPMI